MVSRVEGKAAPSRVGVESSSSRGPTEHVGEDLGWRHWELIAAEYNVNITEIRRNQASGELECLESWTTQQGRL